MVGLACTLLAWAFSARQHPRAFLLPAAAHSLKAGHIVKASDIVYMPVPAAVASKTLGAPFIGKRLTTSLKAHSRLAPKDVVAPPKTSGQSPLFRVDIPKKLVPSVTVGDHIWLFQVETGSPPQLIVKGAPVVAIAKPAPTSGGGAVVAVSLASAQAILALEDVGHMAALIGPPPNS